MEQNFKNLANNFAEENKDIKKLISNCGIALGGLIVIISCFLTYVSASVFGFSASTTLWKGGDGKYFIILVIVSIVLAFINIDKGYLISSFMVVGLTLFEIQDASDALKDLGDLKSVVDYGAGYYLMIIGTIILAIAAVLKFALAKKSAQ